mmetsp:Transcript_20986/g.21776  ORF Transcript_20986/g.21776 Transcript_20986/m.21776 type:complete len:371 (+) Transcript_20986:1-1113(+)
MKFKLSLLFILFCGILSHNPQENASQEDKSILKEKKIKTTINIYNNINIDNNRVDVVINNNLDSTLVSIQEPESSDSSSESSSSSSESSGSSSESSVSSSSNTSEDISSSENVDQEKLNKITELKSKLKANSFIVITSKNDLLLLKESTVDLKKELPDLEFSSLRLSFKGIVLSSSFKTELYEAFSQFKVLDFLYLESIVCEDSSAYEMLENSLAHIKIKNLFIEKSDLKSNSNDDSRLIRALMRDSKDTIEHINISETHLSTGLFNALADNSDSLSVLKKVSVKGADMEAQHGSFIADFIESSNTLEEIILSNNNFDWNTIKEIVNASKLSSSLKSIDLSNNEVTTLSQGQREFLNNFREQTGIRIKTK